MIIAPSEQERLAIKAQNKPYQWLSYYDQNFLLSNTESHDYNSFAFVQLATTAHTRQNAEFYWEGKIIVKLKNRYQKHLLPGQTPLIVVSDQLAHVALMERADLVVTTKPIQHYHHFPRGLVVSNLITIKTLMAKIKL